MPQIFNTAPRPGESNLAYGLRWFPQSIVNGMTGPFMPGGGMDLIHGGMLNTLFNPQRPGSLANQGLGLWNKLGVQADDLTKAVNYMNAPATGAPAPKEPPRPFKQAAQPAEAAPSKYPFIIPAGVTITSDYRTPQHNKDVGGVSDSYHTRRDQFGRPEAVDMVPGKGQTMTGLFAMVKTLNPGADVLNEGDHVHIEPGRGGAGMQGPGPNMSAFAAAANATGLNAPPPAFNNSGFNQAMQLAQQAGAQQMQPFGAQYQRQELPSLPEPAPLQTPDYSAGDKAFAAAAPKNPFEQDGRTAEQGKLHVRRADYFAGMAQAMASIDWSRGVGLGELFAKLGAGALMGAKAGDQEVQDRMDKFDAAMQSYNLALANRDDTKARDSINIANQNIQSMNQYKRDQWTIQTKQIEADQPTVVDGVLITKQKQPDGTIKETHTPIDPARRTASLMAQANIAMAQGRAQNEYNWQTYRANREIAGAALPYAMADAASQGNTQGRDGIFAVGLAEAANAVTDSGRWAELYQRYLPGGGAAAASRQREAYAAAGVPMDDNGNLMPGAKIDKDAQERINDYISSKMIEDFTNSGKSWVLTGGEIENRETGRRKVNPPSNAVTTSIATQRERERRVSRTTNAKGQTSTTESF